MSKEEPIQRGSPLAQQARNAKTVATNPRELHLGGGLGSTFATLANKATWLG